MTSDSPITSKSEDRLGRATFATELATTLRAMRADHGVVVGLMAPWGHGKTSVLNMVVEELVEPPQRTVLTFNPWMFTGTDQLVAAFFEQVAAQIRQSGRRNRRLADWLVDYGQAVSPLVFVPVAGVWLARMGVVATSTGKLLNSRKKIDPVAVQRDRIERALQALPDPIVVILDDIDRLSRDEIRSMVTLVRLTAHFPNVIYLLAFDRTRVERALGDEIESGRAYLEKIIEVDFDLPAIPQYAVVRILVDGLGTVTASDRTGPFDEYLWPDVLDQVLRPLFRTVREVNRYLAVLPATLATIGNEVALVDALTLEAVRLRRPDIFGQLPGIRQTLTEVGMRLGKPEEQQQLIGDLVASAGEDALAITSFLKLLFPATQRYLAGSHYGSEWLPKWRRERRVASPAVLDFYFSRVLPVDIVTAATVDMAASALDTPDVLAGILGGLDRRQMLDLLDRLDEHIGEVSIDGVGPACEVLLRQYARLHTDSNSIDPFEDFVVDRLVLRLLKLVSAVADRVALVDSLCSDAPGYNSRLRLLHLVGRHSVTEPRYIAAAEVDRLLQNLCEDIRHADAQTLAAEIDPLDVIASALAEAPADRDGIDQALANPDLSRALLRNSLDEVRSQPIGSLAVRREPFLRWETLATVVGDSAEIRALLDRIEPVPEDDADLRTAAELAERYLREGPPDSGMWRPRPLIVRIPHNSPHSTFSPAMLAGSAPALVLRALTTYDVDAAWDAGADVSGRDFHDLLAELLSGEHLASKMIEVARKRGFETDAVGWHPDPGAMQSSRGAVALHTLRVADEPVAALRYGVLLPDQRGPARLIADVIVSLNPTQDERWFPVSLDDALELELGALSSISDSTADQIWRRVYEGEIPARSTTEIYLSGPLGGADGRTLSSLADTLDLSPLGPPSRPDQPAREGMFAVSGEAPLTSAASRVHLLRSAVERMARDWGYLDVQPGLPDLLSGGSGSPDLEADV